jgi:regulator of protease activity HflC (stomatin/prohibitin superfamily)
VLRRFGRYQGTLGPGPHLRWPFPIESVAAVAPDRVRSLDIGFHATRRAATEALGWESSHGRQLGDPAEDEALLLTGDGQYVELAATLQYAIDRADPDSLRRFVLDVDDAETALRPLAESVVREVVGRRALLKLLTDGRRAAEEAAAVLLGSRLRADRFGIAVRRVAFQDIHPPLAVLDAYRDVRGRPAIAIGASTRPTPIATRSWRKHEGSPRLCSTPPRRPGAGNSRWPQARPTASAPCSRHGGTPRP